MAKSVKIVRFLFFLFSLLENEILAQGLPDVDPHNMTGSKLAMTT